MMGGMGMDNSAVDGFEASLQRLRTGALDATPVRGVTHRFYRYPARFSPSFARVAIAEFSKPGDVILDPYMGGGTSIVEAFVAGRQAVGCDLNSLAIFVARVKTTPLSTSDRQAIRRWADQVVPRLLYTTALTDDRVICARRTQNLNLPTARPIKKVLALALDTINALPSPAATAFTRCVLLNVGQWALNGKKTPTSLDEFRARLTSTTKGMLADIRELDVPANSETLSPTLINGSAADIASFAPFADGTRADLVVTSPPYPGIHVLYHRWQVDGRRETPAPYWLANCEDGRGAAFYNFADRRAADDLYFAESLRTLRAIRAVMKAGALCVQLVAFSNPKLQLRRYLENMELSAFTEVPGSNRRIWRSVPGRRWHAAAKGALSASREVVLVHRAV